MKKTLFSALLTLLVTSFCLAQSTDIRYTILSSNNQEVTLRVDFPTYQTTAVDVNGTTMYRLQMEGAYPLQEAGAPELLTTAASLIIPEGSTPTFEILESSSTEISNFELAPSKGVITRNIDPSTISYVKGASYFENRFQLDNSVALGEPYQLRDFHGMAVRLFPFAYNPVQKKLKAYSSITVKIQFNGSRSIQRPTHVVSTFNNIYENHFLNYNQLRSNPLVEDGDILILCPTEYCTAMQPYINWKIKNGYHVEIVPVENVGSTGTAVKSYIANYYNNNDNLAFILLVGDGGKFPVINVAGNVSDNYYAEIVGNDVYPDVIIGKLSAETLEQVEIQVQKFIQYEQNPLETAHFTSFCGIASEQGPGDNSEYDFQHIRNIDNKLLNYTYTSGYELFEGSQGGLDAAGNPSTTNVAVAVNNGVGIINYTGHGAETFWVTSDFSIGNINSLTNYNKLPFIFSVACVNGAYYGRTCFAEGWLRANKNGKPTGAVGALMSTINQPWNSPMCAQDHMINLLTGYNNTAQKRTYGGIIFNGIIKMLDTYNDYEVARTWILFGDPTLMVRTNIPQQLTVNHEEQVMLGATDLELSSTVEGARITFTNNNEILGTGFIQNGTASMPIPTSLIAMDTIHILASAPNYLPYEADVVLIPSNGPYISIITPVLHDDTGNNDGNADYGETITVDLPLVNMGNAPTNNITLEISTDDEYVTLLSTTATYTGEIQPDATAILTNAFSFQVSNSVPAAHAVNFNVRLQYSGEDRNARKTIILHAPTPTVGNLVINDQIGNNNGKIDFNETSYLDITIENKGNGAAAPGSANLACLDGRLILYRFPTDVASIDANGSQVVSFKIKPANFVQGSCQTTLRLTYYADGYSASKDFKLKIGEEVEDWESGDFAQYNWTNTSTKPWTIDTQNPYDGNYCVRSGAINDNQNSTLTITKYCAGADSISFYYYVSSEDGYDYLKFYINGSVKGSWCGTQDWTYVAFPVPEGQNTFKWSYIKDSYMSAGSDLAKIDHIVFPASSNPVSIDEVVANEDWAIMPNPTADKVQILVPETSQSADVLYQLFDLSGRMLQQDAINGASATLSLGSFSNGLYFIRILKGNTLVGTYKIIKQ